MQQGFCGCGKSSTVCRVSSRNLVLGGGGGGRGGGEKADTQYTHVSCSDLFFSQNSQTCQVYRFHSQNHFFVKM